MNKEINNQKDFIEEYSRFSGLDKKSVKIIIETMGGFIQYCIENNISFRVSNLFELYYSTMKGRETARIHKDGCTERIILPPVIKAKLRLSDSIRKRQKEQSKILKPILEEIEREN